MGNPSDVMSEEERAAWKRMAEHPVEIKLSPEDWNRLVTELEKPPEDNPRLRALLNSKSPWDE